MSAILHADDSTFDAIVLRSTRPVLVDFTATWCGPCRVLDPIVEAIAEERRGALEVVKVDIDSCPEVSRRYGIRGAPTIIVFEGGKLRGRQVGVTTKERLLALAAG